MPDPHDWLATISRLRAIAQTGLAYSRDPYDRERFTELRERAEHMLAWLVGTEPSRISEIYLPERGYPTPKIDVRAGVFVDDTVLLVQESSDGRWSLPGGWGDEPRGLHRTYKLFFLCELLGGEARPSVETTAAKFFPVTELPELSLGRTLPDDVKLLFEHLRDPRLSCYVD